MDSRQGPHQVAQKSRRTTFPLSLERVISFPSIVLRVKSGAKPGEDFLSLVQWGRKNNDEMQTQTVKKNTRGYRFIYKGQRAVFLAATEKSQIH